MAQKLIQSDIMLDEIHRIRREMIKGFKSKQWTQWYENLQASNRRFLDEKGFLLVKDQQGFYVLVKKH